MERTALCHCGSLRVIAAGKPNRVYVCHCVPCQRRTGAIMHSGAIFLKNQVRIEGASKVYARNADSGYEVRFHFCPNCGSNIYYEFDRSPDECGIPGRYLRRSGLCVPDLLSLRGVDASLGQIAVRNRSLLESPTRDEPLIRHYFCRFVAVHESAFGTKRTSRG